MNEKHTILLREEQLQIEKTRKELGKVKVHTEQVTEEKTITIPLTREEIVIETALPEGKIEVMRIPLREEQLEIHKHMVEIEDVSVYMKQTEELQHIEETLRKEKLRIEATGTAIVHEELL
ncbi:YsnF/AvaK domain-containing protein [Ectobacillus ponti]|uniref:YsnF/AvaK domain-containing protein n=1 Tax=Ectobacillus ponti TaxID=2961894 RepID=A0AA41X9X0_9BACI|nr:YsnF/AvaK domain-containing protein [Ectobacillus ponti]MCP8968101.1 YsnF/AvaK domain-containing protein [Ectobacillus ponti]